MIAMTFHGLLPVQCFANFAQHRATRLSLEMDIVSQNIEHACFVIQGPPVLIDAFEMAMSLGPAECQVHTIARQNISIADIDVGEIEEIIA